MCAEQAQRIIRGATDEAGQVDPNSTKRERCGNAKVLDAMLQNARETGGESSQRYTACAICACSEIHEQVDLARTWFMYLLWPCKLQISS